MIALLTALLSMPVRCAEPAKPRFDKIVVVVFENTDYKEAVKQPFFASFAQRGALLTDYHGVRHPSEPNYVAMISGDTQGIKDDGVYSLRSSSLIDLLEARGRSWKAYAEGYPGDCYLRPRLKKYARKHVPMLSFRSVQKEPGRCAKVVGADQFFVDLSSGSLPDYSFFVPDLNDDGHDTGVAFADKWFEKSFGPLLDKWPDGALLVATFDEDSDSGGTNQIYTALFGSTVQPGARDDERYTHYSLLRTLEVEWGLGDLGANDADAKPITGIWKPGKKP